ncbi:hypothetical protein [Nocardia arthritidis]|uniref:hypothetical protein n=1 Tax=Nocardia arthritidis TaxID=228602 RepID=UPI000A66E7BD|nr:hypothetical protein [Nocardia arthritidis]
MTHHTYVEDRTIRPDQCLSRPPHAGEAVADDIAASSSGRQLWRRWFGLVTVGELLGFLTPAVVGALVADRAGLPVAGALLVAGAVEGATLGWFQARAVRPALPGLSSRRWVAATVLGAVVAWSVGALFVVTDGLSGWSRAPQVATFVAGGLVILLSIGVAQWVVLRAHVHGAARWIAATAAAWLAGLTAFTAFTTPLWQPGQATALVAVIGVFGGLLMAAAMAAVSGLFLVRLLGRADE